MELPILGIEPELLRIIVPSSIPYFRNGLKQRYSTNRICHSLESYWPSLMVRRTDIRTHRQTQQSVKPARREYERFYLLKRGAIIEQTWWNANRGINLSQVKDTLISPSDKPTPRLEIVSIRGRQL